MILKMSKDYLIVARWASEPILLQQVCHPSGAACRILNVKLIEFSYSAIHSMQILRSAQTVL